MTFTVAVPTFGDLSWINTAQRAIESAKPQAPVMHIHASGLIEARNQLLEQCRTEYIVYLDADDELEPDYISAMAGGSADIRIPRVRMRNRLFMPQVWGHRHACSPDCLQDGNWIVIGAAARTELLRAIGGWREFAWSEDWYVWLKCWKQGANFETIPDAIYKQHRRLKSRNHAISQRAKSHWHQEIYNAAMLG